MNNLKEEMLKYFTPLAEKYSGDVVNRVGWSSRDTQIARFIVLEDLCITKSNSILDVGCGVGDYYQFLLDQGFSGEYYGCDLIEKNCQFASIKYPSGSFINADILDFNESRRYDFVIASGIFFLPASDWEETTKKTLSKMYKLCNIAFAANFLTIYSTIQEQGSFHVNPAQIIDYIIPLTPKFRIRHDYSAKGNDFTLFGYR